MGILLGAFAVGFGGCARAMDYETLHARLKAGGSLRVEMDEKALTIEGPQTTRIAGDDLVKFLDGLVSSPGLVDHARGGSKEHEEIFRCVQKVDRLVGDAPNLHDKLTNFYAKNMASPSAHVQEEAFEALLRKRLVKNRFGWDEESKSILLAFVEKNPTAGTANNISIGMGNALTLLGMSEGGPKAIALLESLDGRVPEYELSRKVALARLGVKKYADEMIERYRKTGNLREKGCLAAALGQISSEETLSLLAKDLRDAAVTDEGMGFNQYVLAGLQLAKEFPGGGLRFSRQGDQADFDRAETWCVERFKTVWEKEKPPVRQLRPVIIDP